MAPKRITKVLFRVPIKSYQDFDISRDKDSIVIIGINPVKWIDITNSCDTVLKKSQASSGYYCAIVHDKKLVAACGFGQPPIILNGKYKIERVPDGNVSFRVFMKNV